MSDDEAFLIGTGTREIGRFTREQLIAEYPTSSSCAAVWIDSDGRLSLWSQIERWQGARPWAEAVVPLSKLTKVPLITIEQLARDGVPSVPKNGEI